MLLKAKAGYDQHYMHIKNTKGEIVGMALFNYDHTNLGGHRAYIRHLSTLQEEIMPSALQLVIDYIWKHIPSDNIRVELFHYTDREDNKMKCDPFMKQVYAEKRFRWKTLVNDPKSGKRAQIMQLNRTDKITRKEPFEIKLALVLEMSAYN